MKHSPIPEHLGYLGNVPDMTKPHWQADWRELPRDLDRLFRAAPALVEVAKDAKALCAVIANEHAGTRKSIGPCCRMCELYNAARAALAMLEEQP